LPIDQTKLNLVGRAMNNFARNRLDFSSRIFHLGAEFNARFGDLWSAVSPDSFDPGFDSKYSIGGKQSFVPALGEILWELPQALAAHVPFSACIYRLDNGRPIGYVRVPHYNHDEGAVEEFEKLIAHFENATEALVLDQLNNPGGSMFQMYNILSCLTDRPLIPPKHKLTLTEDDAAMASKTVALGEAGEAVPSDKRPSPQSVAYSRFVLSEIKAGRRVTNPTYLFGVSEILPAQNHYTKGIVVLINELTFSAPEFLAATLQDNKRATLFGSRTAGAGGCVRRLSTPHDRKLGIKYITITWTLALRKNGQPIENIGVHPDVSYSVTSKDLQSGYLGYRQALLTTIGA